VSADSRRSGLCPPWVGEAGPGGGDASSAYRAAPASRSRQSGPLCRFHPSREPNSPGRPAVWRPHPCVLRHLRRSPGRARPRSALRARRRQPRAVAASTTPADGDQAALLKPRQDGCCRATHRDQLRHRRLQRGSRALSGDPTVHGLRGERPERRPRGHQGLQGALERRRPVSPALSSAARAARLDPGPAPAAGRRWGPARGRVLRHHGALTRANARNRARVRTARGA